MFIFVWELIREKCSTSLHPFGSEAGNVRITFCSLLKEGKGRSYVYGSFRAATVCQEGDLRCGSGEEERSCLCIEELLVIWRLLDLKT